MTRFYIEGGRRQGKTRIAALLASAVEGLEPLPVDPFTSMSTSIVTSTVAPTQPPPTAAEMMSAMAKFRDAQRQLEDDLAWAIIRLREEKAPEQDQDWPLDVIGEWARTAIDSYLTRYSPIREAMAFRHPEWSFHRRARLAPGVVKP